MIQLKTYLLTLVCTLFLFQANAQFQLSKESEVSVLTIGPGLVLNDAFGHSAIRIKDPGQRIDLVFDYGRYDFQAEGFYLNFVKGKLDYEIGWANYESFIANYKLQKRRVISQIINFTLEEKQKLFETLQTNIQPQNKSYSYDFFYNNCATKIKDILVNASNKNILFLSLENFEPLTFKYIKSQNPDVKVIGVDAYGSVLKKYHETREVDPNEIYPYRIEGSGKNLIPSATDFNIIDAFVKVTDESSAHTARELAHTEGIFGGYTSGAVLQAVKQLQDENTFKPSDVVVMIFPDHGSRYMSKVYNDQWMKEQGFMDDTLKPTTKPIAYIK